MFLRSTVRPAAADRPTNGRAGKPITRSLPSLSISPLPLYSRAPRPTVFCTCQRLSGLCRSTVHELRAVGRAACLVYVRRGRRYRSGRAADVGRAGFHRPAIYGPTTPPSTQYRKPALDSLAIIIPIGLRVGLSVSRSVWAQCGTVCLWPSQCCCIIIYAEPALYSLGL